jgi:hypothetical protein
MGIKRTAAITIKIKRISVRIFCSWNYTIYLREKRKIVKGEKWERRENIKKRAAIKHLMVCPL